MRRKLNNITKDEWIDLYITKNKTADEIALEFGYCRESVCKYLRKHGIAKAGVISYQNINVDQIKKEINNRS